MNLQQTLKEYGLNNKEAKVYLAILALGAASITEISKKAGLKRPTVYLMIDNLIQKNLLIKTPQGKKVYYKAGNPEKLIQDLEEKKQKISVIVPYLKFLYLKHSKKPGIRFYEGRDKILQVQEEIFRAKEIWAMFSVDNFLKVFREADSRHCFRLLIRHGGFIYDLLEDTKKAREFSRIKYRFGVSEVKFLPPKIKLATDLLVYEDKVALISFENLTTTIIEDPSISQMQKMMLQFIWHNLESK